RLFNARWSRKYPDFPVSRRLQHRVQADAAYRRRRSHRPYPLGHESTHEYHRQSRKCGFYRQPNCNHSDRSPAARDRPQNLRSIMVDITRSQPWMQLEVEDLESAVQFHNKAYWVDNNAVISDEDFDRLVEALRTKAPQSPVLDAIGPEGAAEGFEFEGEKVAHDPPMLSLDKCYDEATLLKWFGKFDGEVVVSPKVDGVAVCIRYDQNGELVIGSTRGNGTVGELITENVKRIVDVPLKISEGPL